MYRKHIYFINLLFQFLLVMLTSMSLGYSYGTSGGEFPISDYLTAYMYLVILILFTIYHYRSPYHEKKSAIYLSIYYFAPAIILGIGLLMSSFPIDFTVNPIDQALQYLYIANGVLHIIAIFGKKL